MTTFTQMTRVPRLIASFRNRVPEVVLYRFWNGLPSLTTELHTATSDERDEHDVIRHNSVLTTTTIDDARVSTPQPHTLPPAGPASYNDEMRTTVVISTQTFRYVGPPIVPSSFLPPRCPAFIHIHEESLTLTQSVSLHL